jgi:hypothetical protein
VHKGRDLGLAHRFRVVVILALELFGELERGAETIVPLDLEGVIEDRAKRSRNRVEPFAVELSLADVEQHCHFVVAGAKRSHQQHLAEDDAEREEVRAAIDVLCVGRLGTQIADFALDDPVLGVLLTIARPRDAEICQLDFAVVRNDDVAWADVAVDDLLWLPVRRAEFVRKVETGAGLVDDPRRQPPRTTPVERTEPLQDPEEVTPGHVLHGDIGRAFGLAEVVDLDDVGMDQA